jgi:hypothetical protein
MRLFGKAQLIGAVVVSFDPFEAKRMTARIFTEDGATVLHWHDEALDCNEFSFKNSSAALAFAEQQGITHVIVGPDGTLADRVPLAEARILAMADGAMAFNMPLLSGSPEYIH